VPTHKIQHKSDEVNIMYDNDWRRTTVGEFAPFVYGKSLPAFKRNRFGSVPVFGSNGIVGYHDCALTDGPAVIIGRKGTVGALQYSATPCWPIDTTFFVSGKDCELTRFQYYALKALDLHKMNIDSAVPELNRKVAHSRDLWVPSENRQRGIAQILGALDDKIELNRRMNQTLEDMARALFKSWFVDFEPVRAKMDGRWLPDKSLPGLPVELYDLFSDRLIDSELGMIPDTWQISTLGSCFNLTMGQTPPPSDTYNDYKGKGMTSPVLIWI